MACPGMGAGTSLGGLFREISNLMGTQKGEAFEFCVQSCRDVVDELFIKNARAARSCQELLGAELLGFAELRSVLVSRMVKPPDFVIVAPSPVASSSVERDAGCDMAARIALHKNMCDIIVFLTNVDPEGMVNLIKQRLQQELELVYISDHLRQVRRVGDARLRALSPSACSMKLTRLSWVIGEICDSVFLPDRQANMRFFVFIVKEFLAMCELAKSKVDKAVVASSIMHVVGRHTIFLNQHWKFLKTVTLKLLEFMQETFPGVQEMAVRTFSRISQKCGRRFVTLQSGEQIPFIEELLGSVQRHTCKLEQAHRCIFFEAVGCMISKAVPDVQSHLRVLAKRAREANPDSQQLQSSKRIRITDP